MTGILFLVWFNWNGLLLELHALTLVYGSYVFLTIVGKANISMYCHRYNHLRDTIAEVERELQRLHDPLQLNLPTPAPHTASLGEHKK